MKNPDRESERAYYEGVISARASRIKENKIEEIAKDNLIKEQAKDLSELMGKYNTVKTKYEQALDDLPSQIKPLQEEIDNQRKKILEIQKVAEEVESEIGLRGNTLIECLTAVRVFIHSRKDEAHMYAPLVAMLEGEYSDDTIV